MCSADRNATAPEPLRGMQISHARESAVPSSWLSEPRANLPESERRSSGGMLSVAILALESPEMLETILGCLKWGAVGFVVAFALMKLYEASHIHDDIPKPEFKVRQSKRAAIVLSAFAAMLSALVWLLVQNWG